MKNLKIRLLTWAIGLFIMACNSADLYAQDLDRATVKNLVNGKNFVFRAQSAIPMTGRARQLTAGYDLTVAGDSLIAYLPYFGRAYAPVLNGEGGIKFTSTDFQYKESEEKKGWDITIVPKDQRDVRQLFLSISENGYANLRLTSNNRQPISYNGYIVQGKD